MNNTACSQRTPNNIALAPCERAPLLFFLLPPDSHHQIFQAKYHTRDEIVQVQSLRSNPMRRRKTLSRPNALIRTEELRRLRKHQGAPSALLTSVASPMRPSLPTMTSFLACGAPTWHFTLEFRRDRRWKTKP